MMNHLNLSAPTHLTEALRTNMSGGKTVAQMLAEATAATPFAWPWPNWPTGWPPGTLG